MVKRYSVAKLRVELSWHVVLKSFFSKFLKRQKKLLNGNRRKIIDNLFSTSMKRKKVKQTKRIIINVQVNEIFYDFKENSNR